MRNCLLTRLVFGVLCVGIFGSGCAKDPILEAVEAMEDEHIEVAGGEPIPGIPEDPEPGQLAEDPTVAGLAAAPEPGVPEDPTPGTPEEPSPAAPGSEARPDPPPGGDGVALEPEPGIPKEPSPAPAGSPGGADHGGKEEGQVDQGPHVLLRGQVSGGSGEAKIRIDLFDGDQRNVSGPRPKVVGVHEIEGPGPFELSIPVSASRVWIGAYADTNGNNRPDKGEPSGWYARNPIHLMDVPDLIQISLAVEGKPSGLGLDFGE
jgi:hypothetical protein